MPLVGSPIVLDECGFRILLTDGSVSLRGYGKVEPESYVLPASEYARIYRSALRGGRVCSPRIHQIASLLEKRCECRHGWIPMLSTSFLAALSSPELIVSAIEPEVISLRLGLLKSFSGLLDNEAGLLATSILTGYPLAVCSLQVTDSFSVAAHEISLDVRSLENHWCDSPISDQ
jgi:hypothetical protein